MLSELVNSFVLVTAHREMRNRLTMSVIVVTNIDVHL